MGLQVWLPLNGDVNNQGLSGLTVTNNTATVNNNGKIGKCYSFSSTSMQLTLDSNFKALFSDAASVTFWVKVSSSHSAYAQAFTFGTAGTSWNNILFGLDINGSGVPILNSSTGSAYTNCSLGTAIKDDKWHHLAGTFQTNTLKIYLDGVLKNTVTTSNVPGWNSASTIFIGGNGAEVFKNNDCLNDIRFYNHCLSDKEVQEISKGLVLHYKFDDNNISSNNLVKNGFGELGTENWTPVGNVTTTDLPTADSNIKAKFIACESREYIPFQHNSTYKVSFYIKASTSSGTTYPSLFPYDADYNFISNQHSRVGFNLNTMTTLTQALNPGDTQLHVADLSQWNANSGHYYNYAAVFSYIDGTGYMWPDGTYTHDALSYGSGTSEKTNLDKTNNIITLRAAYTGRPRPVGTKVCSATDGSTYFYPLGGIANSSIANWTYKEGTFSSEDNRLIAAKYVRFYTYANGYIAGITLRNLSSSTDTIYDCSGYNNNATVVGTLKTIASTPRYRQASSMTNTGTADHIEAKAAIPLPTDGITASIWVKAPKTAAHVIFAHPNFEFGTLNSLGYLTLTTGAGFTLNNFVDNAWNHIVVIRNDSTYKLYVNGIAETRNGANNYYIHNGDQMWLLNRNYNNSYAADAAISDFRIYATELSEDDILDLYHTSAAIDKNGDIFARELVEK